MDVRDIERMRTRSMNRDKMKELEKDIVSIFWLKVENNECYEDVAVYAVEVPVKECKTKEVIKAKQK